ncbi:MAG TPA: hypothetical protein VF339_03965 [Gammaproteobacteria bacterium]
MPTSEEALQERRNDHDVTNTVDVTTPRAVRQAVIGLLSSVYSRSSLDPLWIAFHDFERIYGGFDQDYHGVDTSYHDIQHSLDVTLALARLIVGYDSVTPAKHRLGAERATFALVAALFHDSGYLRHRIRDSHAANGAEFTRTHVTRSGLFLERYLPKIGLDEFVPIVSPVVHFTGYEIPLERIELDDPTNVMIGRLIGTADLITQLADRCYLEKCRDRLYPEFVLGGLAFDPQVGDVRYRSGRHLLSQTLTFYQSSVHLRLERGFQSAYRYFEPFFGGGSNPYVLFVRKNLTFLLRILQRDEWHKLRRRPPCVIPDPYGEARVMALALKRVRERTEAERAARGRRAAVGAAVDLGSFDAARGEPVLEGHPG